MDDIFRDATERMSHSLRKIDSPASPWERYPVQAAEPLNPLAEEQVR